MLIKTTTFCLALLGISMTAHAEETVTVKKLALAQQRIVVATTAALPEGRILKLKGGDCQMAVTKSNAHVAVLNVSDCGQASTFRAGQTLTMESAIANDDSTMDDDADKAGAGTHHLKRALTDLEFVPLAKQIFIRGTYDRNTLNTVVVQSGVNLVTIARTQSLLNATVYYGVTDRFAAGAAIGYAIGDSATSSYGDASALTGQSQAAPSSGMTDPNLLGVYRFYEQGPDSFNLDITFSYSPKLLTATYASGTSAGTEARGGDAKAVGAVLTHKGPDWAYGGRLNYLSNGAASGSDATSGSTVNVGGQTVISLAGLLQYHVSPKIFLPFILTDSMYSSQNSDAQAASAYSQFSWLLGANYAVSKKMTVYFNYIYRMTVTASAVQGVTGNAENITNGPNNTMRLGLTYLL